MNLIVEQNASNEKIAFLVKSRYFIHHDNLQFRFVSFFVYGFTAKKKGNHQDLFIIQQKPD